MLYPTTELSRCSPRSPRVTCRQRMAAEREGQPLRGESGQLCRTVNGLLDQLAMFAEEVTRVGREIGTEGQARRSGQGARCRGPPGRTSSTTSTDGGQPDRAGARTSRGSRRAVADGDLSRKITVEVSGEMLGLKNTVNTMVDQLSAFADEVTRVAREGRYRGPAGRSGAGAGRGRDLA